MKFSKYSFIVLATFFFCSSAESPEQKTLPLERINLPDGFKIEVFAEVPNARSMTRADDGTIYVGARRGGKIHAVRDNDGDFKADEVIAIGDGFNMPNGVAMNGDDLYVAEVNRILRYNNIGDNLKADPEYEVIYDEYPTDRHHGWKYIAFGPDGMLYVPVGAPCNICEKDNEVYSSITRINPDGTGMEVFAHGVRNSVGFTWHPDTGDMWFTDNGRDMLGDDSPPCELNLASEKGMHFGYPYCHGGDLADPEFGSKRPCDDFVAPAQNLGPHVAPLGLKFYAGDMFPTSYKKQLIIAEHGSWNRSSKIGYRLMMVTVDGNKATSYETFADGWLDDEEQTAFGRPVDVLELPDGSMLVSDDFAGVIYRITYTG